MKTMRMSVLTSILLIVPAVVFAADQEAPVDLSQDICNSQISKEEVEKIRKAYENHKACAYNTGKLAPNDIVKKRGEIQNKYNAKFDALPKNTDSRAAHNELIKQLQTDLKKLEDSVGKGKLQMAEMFKKDYEDFEKVFKAFEERRKNLCAEKNKIGQGLGVVGSKFDVSRIEAHGATADAKKHCEYYKDTDDQLKKGKGALSSYMNKLSKTYEANRKLLRDLKSKSEATVAKYGEGSYWTSSDWCYNSGWGVKESHLNKEIKEVYADKEGALHKLNDRIFGAEIPRFDARKKEIDGMQAKLDTAMNRCVSVADEKEKSLSKKEWERLDAAKEPFRQREVLDSATAKKVRDSYMSENSAIGDALRSSMKNKEDAVRMQDAYNKWAINKYGLDGAPTLYKDGDIGKRSITAFHDAMMKDRSGFLQYLQAEGFTIDTNRGLATQETPSF
ncbi:MAG: hypothetical protein M9962_15635 [Oligoflexia bacterium]|nr:hypothetical protein [Oligoflexia bacterium]